MFRYACFSLQSYEHAMCFSHRLSHLLEFVGCSVVFVFLKDFGIDEVSDTPLIFMFVRCAWIFTELARDIQVATHLTALPSQ